MNNRFFIGGLIITVFLGFTVYFLMQSTVAYENDFSKIISQGRTVKATGAWIKEKQVIKNSAAGSYTFFMKDSKNTELKVVYSGFLPGNFESSTVLVVTGKFNNGVFEASEILTKCPSKYENRMQ